MSEQNKAISKRYREAWNARDLDAFDEIYAADAVHHDSQNPFVDTPGPECAKRFARAYHAAFSDGHFEVREQIAQGDFVVTRWSAEGTNDGELLGMPPTNKAVSVDGITIDRLADGKIVETWACWDTLGMLQQLGAIPQA